MLTRVNKVFKVTINYKFFLRHSLMLHWFADLMNVTEEVTIHRPNVSTLLSSTFIRGDEGTRQECRNVGSMSCYFFSYIH